MLVVPRARLESSRRCGLEWTEWYAFQIVSAIELTNIAQLFSGAHTWTLVLPLQPMSLVFFTGLSDSCRCFGYKTWSMNRKYGSSAFLAALSLTQMSSDGTASPSCTPEHASEDGALNLASMKRQIAHLEKELQQQQEQMSGRKKSVYVYLLFAFMTV
jgi:hypothetical protein